MIEVSQWAYILPLLAGLIYAFSAMCMKKALAEGYGVMRITFLANIASIAVFSLLLFQDNQILDHSRIWAPILTGAIYFIGISLLFATMRIGDVSIQTPLFGTKIIFVAIFITLLYQNPVPLPWWIAAFLAMIAIGCMGAKTPNSSKNVILKTIILTLISSVFFAFNDIIVSEEAPGFGKIPFLVIMIGTTAFLSFGFIPFFRGGLFNIPRPAWKWALLGVTLGVTNQVLFFLALAYYGNPTAINILYSSRGIWSVLIVWSIGHWFQNQEKDAGSRIMKRRLVGASLLFVAIVIVLLSGE